MRHLLLKIGQKITVNQIRLSPSSFGSQAKILEIDDEKNRVRVKFDNNGHETWISKSRIIVR